MSSFLFSKNVSFMSLDMKLLRKYYGYIKKTVNKLGYNTIILQKLSQVYHYVK